MRGRTALAGACITTVVLGLSAPLAMAGDIRPDTDKTTGVKRLLFSEARDGVVTNPDGTTSPGPSKPETNQLTITQAGPGNVLVHDAATPLTATQAGGANRCVQVDVNTANCPITNIQVLGIPLGALSDTFDNETSIPSSIRGGLDNDTIINSGNGNDTIELKGSQPDVIQSCGAGVDRVSTDPQDVVDASCEYVNTPIPTATAPTQNPTVPTTTNVVKEAPAGTPAPVNIGTLGVAPLKTCTAKFIGMAGVDRIIGTAGGDIAYGLAGDDYLQGGLGGDCLYGLDGNDTVVGEGGVDLIVGNGGDDKLYGGDGNDRLYGMLGADRLQGDDGNDRMSGGSGNDRLYGLLGSDTMLGGTGNDTLDGSGGNDTISGGGGRDRILGGSGKDKITAGGSGGDTISGSAGDDTINARNKFRDRIDCGSGRDRVTADKSDIVRNCERVTRR